MKKNHRIARARRALLTLSLVLITMVVAVGGTIAWLTAESDTVTNTFSPSNISVTLEEFNADEGSELANDYQIIPGDDIEKDPTVTASANVPYYVFVKVESSNWPTNWFDKDENGNLTTTKKLSYEVNTSTWTLVEGEQEVYYIAMDDGGALGETAVLKGNKVTVSSQITKEELAEITSSNKKPTIVVTAYAIQQEGFTSVEDAWNEVKTTYPAN